MDFKNKNVYFVNSCNFGDIHVSRSFVKKIIQLFPENNYYYVHQKPARILLDVDVQQINDLSIAPFRFIEYASQTGINFLLTPDSIKVIDDNVYINTWYMSNYRKYYNKYMCTFSSLYQMFNDYFLILFDNPISHYVNNPLDLYPQIDFSKYEIAGIDNFIKNNWHKLILISNGDVLSGQSDNADMSIIINKLASVCSNSNIKIIYTNKNDNIILRDNVIFSGDIIQCNGEFDLNQNGYLSTFCDIIIGRASGAYTFATNKINLYRDVKMLSFSKQTAADVQTNYFLGQKFKKPYQNSINANYCNYTPVFILKMIMKYMRQI